MWAVDLFIVMGVRVGVAVMGVRVGMANFESIDRY